MSVYYLTFSLQSDALFGRGDGVAGLIDLEVQHDEYGCPYLGGRTLKGILVNECADILAALSEEQRLAWDPVAHALFGSPGSRRQEGASVRFGDAQLPAKLRDAIKRDIERDRATLAREDVLASLTTIRRQTAMDARTGAPKEETLRTLRLVLRETIFEARIVMDDQMPPDVSPAIAEKMPVLLAACVKAFRRAGTGRNRGHGKLQKVAFLDTDRQPITQICFDQFCKEVL